MLTDRFNKYIDKQTSTLPLNKATADFKAELYDTLMSKASDLSDAGLSEDEIFTKCVDTLGDFSETKRDLSSNPIDMVRDGRILRKFLYCGVISIISVILYIGISYFANNWSIPAYTIFPAMGIILIAYLTFDVIKHSFMTNRHGYTTIIFSLYALILLTCLYLGLAFGINAGWAQDDRAWSIFPFIFPIIFLIHITKLRVTGKAKKGLSLFTQVGLTMSSSIAVFLLVATIIDEFHPTWLIVLIGILLSLIMIIKKLDKRIYKNKSIR
ncbi:MAG: hypothetical protein LBF12_01295 [Christensenellaceae bacterium]|jgi:hypothetical protein|nr:hypothetical protein [Christensenellaceae bacterium]